MSDILPNLKLPVLQPSQAQKHVTHNEALSILDAVVQLSASSASTQDPPAAPDEGDRFIVPQGATGTWAGQADKIASYENGAWMFHTPQPGWRAYVLDVSAFRVFEAAGWRDMSHSLLENLIGLGIGTDTTSAPFSAKLNAALWTALYAGDGGTGDLIQTLNRETTADDAGLVLQTDFVSHALAGLFGNGNLRLAVSQDGSNFLDGLVIDAATGIASQPQLPRFAGKTNFDNYAAANTWIKIAINDLSYNDQGVFDAATNLFTAPADGLYQFHGHALFKVDTNDKARMRTQIVKNGTDILPGTFGQITSNHDDGKTVLDTSAAAPLLAGDTIEYQGSFQVYSGYFQADETTFWGMKMG